jgi:hypothetical protein
MSNQAPNLLIIIALIGYVFYLQVALRPVRASKYIIFPAILVILTLDSVYKLIGVSNVSLTPLCLLTAIGVLLGITSGIITRVFTGVDGKLYQHGGWPTILFLLITVPIRFGLRHTLAMQPGNEILKNIGVSYLVLISSQLVSRSFVIILKLPKIWNIFLEERKKRRKRRRKDH